MDLHANPSASSPGLRSRPGRARGSGRGRVAFIDGDKGILRYRGYPIEELAEKSNYLETAYLIVKGELPDREHYGRWENNIKIHTMVHESIKQFMQGYRYDAHPMGMLLGT